MLHVKIDDSVSLYYHVKGKGKPIVFIHPPVIGHKVFKHQEELADRYQTIFYDLRGHGQSTAGNARLSIPLLTEDLKKLLDEIGISKAVVCAFSNGGTVAQDFALQYPERTEALILSGGYSEVNSFSLKSTIKLGMTFAKLNQIPLIAKVLAKTHKVTKEDEEEFFQYACKANPQRVYEFCKAGLSYSSTERLHQLKIPVLLVYGSNEKTMHHYRKPFQEASAYVKVNYIKGAFHEVPPRHFREFNEAIHRFLQQAGTSDPTEELILT
ncbi:alpha/beta hydrolase [Bacillus sp. 37MA]|uniref:alpha/beta fold hydrolase n=1 Tax=Bacillus sp. 37MA TaxID=1132442 RepID=UPI0003617CD8|nr:alpha/beta hydrolase [Bacillus sp. 37MA]